MKFLIFSSLLEKADFAIKSGLLLALTIILTIIIYICTITGAWYLTDEIYRIIGGPDLNSQYTIDFFKIIMYIIFATILLITAHLSFVFILAGIVEFLCEGLK